eukprot:TRINITY_DN4394_c0_g1_i1.p1 TRINITY_DN4394_c0_g1~~TRINITY_DN4394_c0_g1_i1.p1  ORF type:complete len:824 (-),score=145.73 TRINITY_DN4394_c0_g1_i1:441-2780(-)
MNDHIYVPYKLNAQKRVWSEITTEGHIRVDFRFVNRNFGVYSDGIVYLLDPRFDEGRLISMHCYLLDTKRWVWDYCECLSKPLWVTGATVSVVGGKLVLFGGKNATNVYTNQISVLSIDGDVWEWRSETNSTGVIPTPRCGHSSVGSGDQLFVMGGFRENSFVKDYYQASLYMYDDRANSWEDRRYPPKSNRMESVSLGTDGNYLFTFGGYNTEDKKTFNALAIHDIATKRWAKLDVTNEMYSPTPRFGSSISVFQDRAYIFGGSILKNQTEIIYLNELCILSFSPNPITKVVDSQPNIELITEEEDEPEPIPVSGKISDLLEYAFQRENFFQDMVFIIDEQEIYAHQIILYNSSPKFKKLLERWNKKPRSSILTIEVEEDWPYDIFLKFIQFLYTGKIGIEDKQESQIISEIAYEYLIDSLLSFCNTKKNFPTAYIEKEEVLATRMRKSAGSNIGSDFFIVLNGSQKILCHKVILYLMSPTYRNMIREGNEYAEYTFDNIDSSCFISFLRILFSNYSSGRQIAPQSVIPLISLAFETGDNKLLSFMQDPSLISSANLGHFALAGDYFDLEIVKQNSYDFFELNFADLSKDKDNLPQWPKKGIKLLAKYLLSSRESMKSFSWLDIFWFSHNCDLTKLKQQALDKLTEYLNLDNVVSVLVASHHIGEKELRNTCVEMMVKNAEYFVAHHKDPFFNLTLSESMTENMLNSFNEKKREQKTNKSRCQMCKTTLGLFSKKNSCALCNATICTTDSIQCDMPALLGDGKRILCPACESIIGEID